MIIAHRRTEIAAIAGLWYVVSAVMGASVESELQQRLDRAAETGAVVTLEAGEYTIREGLRLRDATLRGPGATIRVVHPEDAEGYLFGIRLGSDAVLRDIRLIGEGPRCVPVGIAGNSKKVQVRHVTIEGGTILLDANVPEINDILIEGCDLYGGGYGVLLDRRCSGGNVRITDCHFRDNGSDSIELNFPDKEKGNVVRNVTIADNIFEGTGDDPNSGSSGFGVGIAGGHHVQITGNSFYKSAVQGIHLEDNTRYVTITGNNFEECGLGCTTGNWTGGVHILSGTRYVTVNGNNFARCRFGVSGLQGNTLQDVTVTGNTFEECEKGGWFMEFPMGIFSDNIVRNCGTALELWRSRGWIVTDNYIAADITEDKGENDEPAIGIRCFGYRHFICTDNILNVDIAFDHHDKNWYDQHYIVEDNLIVRGKRLENGEPMMGDKK